LLFQQSDFPKPAQVPLVLTELGRQERLDEVPGNRRAYRPAADANDVEVIVPQPPARQKNCRGSAPLEPQELC